MGKAASWMCWAGWLVLTAGFVGNAAHAGPGDILFQDDFEDGNISPWVVSYNNNNAGVNTDTAQSGSHSMFLRWDLVASDSPTINANVPGAELSVWIRRGDDAFSEAPEAGEDLRLQYQNSNGNWVDLEVFPGDGAPGEVYVRTYVLPADALHPNLRIGFLMENASGSDFDYWHIDDVVVTETGGGFCAPGADLSESFESGGLGAWQSAGPGDTGASQATAGNGSWSAFLSERRVELRSPNVDFSAATSVDVSVWVRRGSDTFSEAPEAGEDLILEFRDDSNNWTVLETFPGGGTPGEIFQRTYSLPATAFHPNFRLQFRFPGGSGNNFDFWHVDSICMTSGGGIGGFQIALGTTTASTCAPLVVDITALNNGGNPQTGYNGTVQITTSSGHGDWANVDGVGVFDNGVADDGAALYEFSPGGGGDDGTVQLQLSNVHADDLVISVEDISDPATLSTSAQVSFRDNAFVVTENDALDNIPVAGRPHSYQIQQIRRDSGGQCGVNTNYQGNIGLKAWIGRDAADPGGTAPTIGGTPLPGAAPGANNLSLNFTGGTANFTLGTTDVGKYGINFTDDTSGFAVDASNNPRPISGGTAAIQTVRPFGFAFSGVPFDVGSGGADFRRAGELFSLGVSAVQWQAADDADGNGIPDGHGQTDNNRANDANLADNAVTPAYAWTTTLQAARPTGPAAGALGVLNGGPVASGSFAGGSTTQTGMQYTEAGEVSVYAELQNYLGTGGASTHSLSPLVGRFVPDHYDVAVTRQGCFVGGFTYAEQPVGEITVTARNSNGVTTANYTGAWSRDVTLTETSPAGSLSGNTAGGGQFANGVLTLSDQVVFALADPETAPLNVALAVTADERATPAPGNGAAGSVSIRSGRVMLDDAVGSELLPLDLPLRIEYYAGSNTGWTVNTADTCTTTGDLGFAISNDTAGTSISGSSLSNASGSVTLAVPGSTGHADVTVSGPAWLQSNRDGVDQGSDGDLSDDDDQGRGTFGVYEGDDNLIYQREQY